MTWPAVIAGDEAEVEPTPQWIRSTLGQIRLHEHEAERFICLIRSGDDQMNVLAVDGAFVLEWFLASEGGHLAGFRTGQEPARIAKRPGLLARLFGARSPLHGSRISLEEASQVLDAYVSGANTFPAFVWKNIR